MTTLRPVEIEAQRIERANFPLRQIIVGQNSGINLRVRAPHGTAHLSVNVTESGGAVREHEFAAEGNAFAGHLPSWMFPNVATLRYDVVARDESGAIYWCGAGQIVVFELTSNALPPIAPPEGYIMRDGAGRKYKLTVVDNDLGQGTLMLEPITESGVE